MSADNSPRSESNQSSRYQRAADQQQPATASPQEPIDPRRREATRRQAEEDRRKRGEAKKLDQVSALFGGSVQPKPQEGAQAANRKPSEDAGRDVPHAPQSRPALELDEDEREEGDEDRPKRKKSKSIVDFAAEHEMKAEAIFDLAVPLEAGAEPVTIGQLKDHYKETRDFEQKRDEFADWQEHAQGEVIQARQQIDDVLQRVTSVIPPEVLARAFADSQHDMTARIEKSRGQLREWFPEWADAQVKARDRERLEQVLSTYGFSKFEVGSVNDARLIKFAMDAIRKADRYDRLKAGGQREKLPSKEPTSQRKPRQPNATDQAHQLAEKGDKVGAVATLIGMTNGHAKSR